MRRCDGAGRGACQRSAPSGPRYEVRREELLYELKAGPAGGRRPPSGRQRHDRNRGAGLTRIRDHAAMPMVELRTSNPELVLRELTLLDAEAYYTMLDRNRGHLGQHGDGYTLFRLHIDGSP